VFTVRSIRGDWMKVVAKNTWPHKSSQGRIEELAKALKISRRSCYAYVAEERRVPEEVEQRFISLFGEIADDGWRTLDLYRFRTPAERKVKKPAKKPGVTKERYAAIQGEWIERATKIASILSEDLLGHVLAWEEHPITYGQIAMIEEGLDEQEARRRHPNNFDGKAMTEDVVAVCKACGLIGAIDASVKEVNGLVFEVTCRTDSYKVSE